MDLSGKVTSLLPEVSGSSKSGNAWRKQEYIVETGGQYPKKVCVSIWGDKIDQFGLKVGEQVTLGIDVESREYNGRWYTEVKAYKVDRSQGGGMPVGPPDVDTPLLTEFIVHKTIKKKRDLLSLAFYFSSFSIF
jgi:hypothetical protein